MAAFQESHLGERGPSSSLLPKGPGAGAPGGMKESEVSAGDGRGWEGLRPGHLEAAKTSHGVSRALDFHHICGNVRKEARRVSCTGFWSHLPS